MRYLALLAATFVASSASAQIVTDNTPKGVTRVAAVGEEVWREATYKGVPGVTISAPVQETFVMNQVVSIPAGATLMTIREKKLKVCRRRVVIRLGGMSSGGWKDCLIDKDGDGQFEMATLNEVSGGHPIPPVPYIKGMVPLEGAGEGNFKRVMIFLGRTSGDIRLSYREFANDLARPAFTEELSLSAPESFPAIIKVKSATLRIEKIDGEGLHYSLIE